MEHLASMNKKLTEQELVVGCSDGNREAFEAFYRSNQRRVFSVAVNFFGGDRHLAEDVTQQVFLKIFTSPATFRGESNISTWLYRVTVNACLDARRKTRRYSFLPDFLGFPEPSVMRPQHKLLQRREISAEIRDAVATLKPIFRLPIVLKYVEDLSYREMADILDCSEGTIASRLNRGHKILAKRLEHLRSEV